MKVHNVNAAALSGLDSLSRRLRWLCIEGLESQLTTSSVPGLGQLTHLTRLQLLNNKGFQPILLSGMLHLEVGEGLGREGEGILGPPTVVLYFTRPRACLHAYLPFTLLE
jgi:hypothetical protein